MPDGCELEYLLERETEVIRGAGWQAKRREYRSSATVTLSRRDGGLLLRVTGDPHRAPFELELEAEDGSLVWAGAEGAAGSSSATAEGSTGAQWFPGPSWSGLVLFFPRLTDDPRWTWSLPTPPGEGDDRAGPTVTASIVDGRRGVVDGMAARTLTASWSKPAPSHFDPLSGSKGRGEYRVLSTGQLYDAVVETTMRELDFEIESVARLALVRGCDGPTSLGPTLRPEPSALDLPPLAVARSFRAALGEDDVAGWTALLEPAVVAAHDRADLEARVARFVAMYGAEAFSFEEPAGSTMEQGDDVLVEVRGRSEHGISWTTLRLDRRTRRIESWRTSGVPMSFELSREFLGFRP